MYLLFHWNISKYSELPYNPARKAAIVQNPCKSNTYMLTLYNQQGPIKLTSKKLDHAVYKILINTPILSQTLPVLPKSKHQFIKGRQYFVMNMLNVASCKCISLPAQGIMPESRHWTVCLLSVCWSLTEAVACLCCIDMLNQQCPESKTSNNKISNPLAMWSRAQSQSYCLHKEPISVSLLGLLCQRYLRC
jgi:hypothetical protein